MKKNYEKEKRQQEITRAGNPRKPQGEEGVQMLQRMNRSHFELTDWALRSLELEEGDQVRDIGCGGGAALKNMSERIASGHLTGVDYSEVSVRLSKETNAEDIKRDKMEILGASVEKLPFRDERFDKIITVESFYFWPDPEENLKEVFRVLKKGGAFLLVADIYQKEGLKADVLETVKEYHLLNPTREEFGEMFRQAGFQNIEIHTKESEDWICVLGKRAT